MAEQKWRVPTRIETDRVTLRRYTGADAAALHEVTTANIDFLRPWMWWIRNEPQSVEDRMGLIDFFSAQFESGEGYTLGMFAKDGTYLGGTGFNVEDGELEIGYWLREDAQGQGLVTEVAAALTRVALEYAGAPRVTLAIEPTNAPSVAIAMRLGFSQRGTRLEEFGPGGELRESLLFDVTRADFHATPAATFPVPALRDADGKAAAWPA